MSSIKRFLAAFSLLAVTALACGATVDLGTGPANTALTTATLPQSSQNQLATMVAATLQVYTQQAATQQAAAPPTSTPVCVCGVCRCFGLRFAATTPSFAPSVDTSVWPPETA